VRTNEACLVDIKIKKIRKVIRGVDFNGVDGERTKSLCANNLI